MSFPTSPSWAAVDLESRQPVLESRTDSGRIQTRKLAGHTWAFKANFPPMKRADFQPVWSYAVKQGRHNVFTVVPPVLCNTLGDATGTLMCAAASAGATSIVITGLTGTLKAGDMVKASGHSKVYSLQNDLTGDGSLSVFPPLVSPVGAGETVVYTDVPFTVRLATGVQAYRLGLGGIYNYQVDFEEVL